MDMSTNINTDILSFSQGVRILIEISIFILLYFAYLKLTNNQNLFTDLIVTSFLLALFLFSLTIILNINMSLSIPSNREANISIDDYQIKTD
jgi:hypothetical protein